MRRLRYSLARRACGALAVMAAALALSSCVNSLDEKIKDAITVETDTKLSSISISATGDGTNYRELASFDPSLGGDHSVQLGGASKFRITATSTSEGATISLTCNNGSPVTLDSGAASSPIDVPDGTSSLLVKVVSPNGLHEQKYQLTSHGGFLAGPDPELNSSARPTHNDSFGFTVAVSGDATSAAVGADCSQIGSEYSSLCGYVYAYSYNQTGSSWNAPQVLTDTPSATSDFFGSGVCLSPDGLVLACGTMNYSWERPGILHVFRMSGGNWSLADEESGSGEDYFGHSIAMSSDGGVIAAGAPYADVAKTDDGRVNIYTFSAGSLTAMAGSPIPCPSASGNDRFGMSIALSSDGTVLAVGANGKNAVYIYRYNGTTWGSPTAVVPVAALIQYGTSIGLSSDGTILVVGDTGTAKAYVFTWNGASWVEGQTLSPSDTGTASIFGMSVDISGDGKVILIGAPGDGSIAGAAYRFLKSGSLYSQTTKILPPDSRTGDRFGCSVGLSGDGSRCIVGAYNTQRAYIF